MREILFRAKGTSGYFTNKWAYGHYCKDFWLPRKGHGILPINKEDGGYIEVDPETIGQYTGLEDRNGKKIFEGDILDVMHQGVYKCRWDDGNFEFGLLNESESFGIAYVSPNDISVIGNIHDNPELLEEA